MPLTHDEQRKQLRRRVSKRDHVYHKPPAEVAPTFEGIRKRARLMAQHIIANTPLGREQSIALTKLEEVVFWANAAVARGES